MDRFQKLLVSMCDSLVAHQLDGNTSLYGGFACDACTTIHGRADNAIYPFACAYSLTRDEKYIQAIHGLFSFRHRFENSDGSVCNDGGSAWKGITVFSGIYLCLTLLDYGDILPGDIRTTAQEKAGQSAEWVYNNIVPPFRANINYYGAAAGLNSLYGVVSGKEKYKTRGKELLDYCLSLVTENGLIAGEGQPHNSRTTKGCIPFDTGYTLEETLPCLVTAASVLCDEDALIKLADIAEKLTVFILPDGGIDNSFGSRNNKWTYYGSRTSDGCFAAYARLSRIKPDLMRVAALNLSAVEKCFDGNMLYGGMQYRTHKQAGCIHHLFSHVSGLAEAIHYGICDCDITGEKNAVSVKHLPEIDTVIINKGVWRATVTGYDFRTYTYTNGAAHASGGTLSLLYHREKGAVIAGSVTEYKPTEIFNMQLFRGDEKHAPLLPRAEFKKDGILYTTAADFTAQITTEETDECITVTAHSRPCLIKDNSPADNAPVLHFIYRFSDDAVNLTVSADGNTKGLKFILPVIENTVEMKTENVFSSENIFFLTPGFGAAEYTFPLENTTLEIELK